MERKKIMTWMLTWLNVSAAALNAMLQLLVILAFNPCKCTRFLFIILLLYFYSISKSIFISYLTSSKVNQIILNHSNIY